MIAARALAFASMLLAALMAQAVEVGQPAPDFELPAVTGVLKSGDLRGKTVYLDFWASWCGPCKESFPWMNEMQARYAARGLRIVSINVDQRIEDARAFLRRNPAAFEVAFDQAGKSPRTHGIKSMPTSFLISPQGKVLAVHSGFRDDQRNALENELRQALGVKE